CICFYVRHILISFCEKQRRVTLQMPRFEHHLHHRMPVGRTKTPSVRIKCQTKLTSSPRVFKLKSLGIKTTVGGSKFDRFTFRVFWGANFPSIETTGHVYPAIETKNRMTDTNLSGFI